MNDGPISNDNLNEINKKLTTIEKKISDKWLIPIIVALVTGTFSLVNILVQIKTQSTSQQEIARYIKEEESLGTTSGVEKATFYQKALELSEKIDTNFEAVCYFTPEKKVKINDKSARIENEDPLSDSLEQYRILLETAPVGINDKTKEKLKEYSDFIANSLVEIQEKSLGSNKKTEYLNKSKELKTAAIKLLKENRQQKSFS